MKYLDLKNIFLIFCFALFTIFDSHAQQNNTYSSRPAQQPYVIGRSAANNAAEQISKPVAQTTAPENLTKQKPGAYVIGKENAQTQTTTQPIKSRIAENNQINNKISPESTANVKDSSTSKIISAENQSENGKTNFSQKNLASEEKKSETPKIEKTQKNNIAKNEETLSSKKNETSAKPKRNSLSDRQKEKDLANKDNKIASLENKIAAPKRKKKEILATNLDKKETDNITKNEEVLSNKNNETSQKPDKNLPSESENKNDNLVGEDNKIAKFEDKNNDYEIKYSNKTQASKKNNYFFGIFPKKSFSGSVNHSELSSSSGGRKYTNLNLRFDQKLGSLRIVADGVFEKTSVQTSLGLDCSQTIYEDGKAMSSCNPNLKTPLPRTKSYSYNRSQFRAREAYVSADIGSAAVLNFGKKNITWGQFNLFSPMNAVSPSNLSYTNPAIGKTANVLGQDTINLNLFPHPFVEINSFYMPYLSYDSIVQNSLDKESETESIDNNTTSEFLTKTTQKYKNNTKWKNHSQFGGKILFYPSWGITGFSYFDGYNLNEVIDKGKIELAKTSDGSTFVASKDYLNNYGVKKGSNYYALSKTPGLAKQKMIGFELAVPVKKITMKLELAKISSFMNPSKSSNIQESLNRKINGNASNLSLSESNFDDFIINNKNGDLSIPYNLEVVAAGFDSNFERWLVNFEVVYVQRNVPKPYDVVTDAKQIFVTPAINIGRYTSADKSGIIGIAAGSFGYGSGVSLYYNKEFKESFTFGIALSSVQYYSDAISAYDPLYSSNSDSQTSSDGILFSLGYKF